MNILLTVVAPLAVSNLSIESRTLLDGPATSADTSVILNQQYVEGKRVVRITRTIGPDKSMSYAESVYSLDGVPISTAQEGFWNDRWNVFATQFGAKGAQQNINGEKHSSDKPAKFFIDPTVAWFWRKRPAVGTTTTVNVLAQNVIAIFQLKFTYEGDDRLTLAGRTIEAHRVREKPVTAPEAVYSIYWYDDKGMIVKRYHHTTTSEFEYALTAWR